MMNKITLVAAIASLSIVSCGGGGVSDDFTKQISDYETAFSTASTNFNASYDSLKTGQQNWQNMVNEMKVPDTLSASVTPEAAKKLDSLKNICTNHGDVYTQLTKEMDEQKATLDKDNAAFATWKDKVLKGEIDIETAKKDLSGYAEKIKTITEKSNNTLSQLAEVKTKCANNCLLFDNSVKALATAGKKDK